MIVFEGLGDIDIHIEESENGVEPDDNASVVYYNGAPSEQEEVDLGSDIDIQLDSEQNFGYNRTDDNRAQSMVWLSDDETVYINLPSPGEPVDLESDIEIDVDPEDLGYNVPSGNGSRTSTKVHDNNASRYRASSNEEVVDLDSDIEIGSYTSVLAYDADLEDNVATQSGSQAVPRVSNGASTHTAPPLKRARVTNNLTPSKPARRPRKCKRGCTIINMPVEVLFEIMDYLAPADLLMLARTNRAFHGHLMSGQARLLWQRVRRATRTPEPPLGCSEARWVNLLFGGSKCQSCGASRVSKIEFLLCKRLCKRCLKEGLVHEDKLNDEFPGYNGEILELVLRVKRGGWSPRGAVWRRSYTMYWKDDIYLVSDKLRQMQNNISSREGSSDALIALEEFKTQKRQVIDHIQENVPLWEKWHKDVLEEIEHDKALIINEWRAEAKARFLQFGYREEDVDPAMESTKFPTGIKKLTPGAWRKIMNRFEPEIITHRNERLFKTRKAVLRTLYNAWKRTLTPPQCAHFPTLDDLGRVKIVLDAFNRQELDVENPAVSHCDHLINRLHEVCSSWPDQVEEYLSALRSEMRPNLYFTNEFILQGLSNNLVVLKCNFCPQSGFIYGRDGLLEHAYGCPLPSQIKPAMRHDFRSNHRYSVNPSDICTRASSDLSGIVEAIGKDPRTATRLELDLSGARLYCTKCSTGKPAYTWRQAVEHADNLPGTHEFKMITDPKELNDIRSLQTSRSMGSWLCVHCPMCHQTAKPLHDIRRHLWSCHKISNLAESRDYLWDFRISRTPTYDILPTGGTKAPRAASQESSNFAWRCVYCARDTTRDEARIRTHLRTRHPNRLSSGEPILGTDYEKVVAA